MLEFAKHQERYNFCEGNKQRLHAPSNDVSNLAFPYVYFKLRISFGGLSFSHSRFVELVLMMKRKVA